MLEAFILMMIISTFMYVFDEELIWFFVNHSSLEESSYVGVWTLDVLCFSGPFLGLKIACGAVYLIGCVASVIHDIPCLQLRNINDFA